MTPGRGNGRGLFHSFAAITRLSVRGQQSAALLSATPIMLPHLPEAFACTTCLDSYLNTDVNNTFLRWSGAEMSLRNPDKTWGAWVAPHDSADTIAYVRNASSSISAISF
jgi:hypothetical protein